MGWNRYDQLVEFIFTRPYLVTLNTGCEMFERDRYPANIWIQKQDVGDYLVGNDGPGGVKQKENNHRFPIPIALIEQIQPCIEIAEESNMKYLLAQ